MPIHISDQEWLKIFDELNRNRDSYGFPIRENNSLLLGSWNIRKLGKIKPQKRDDNHFRFFKKVISQFDLIAIQEVMSDLEGICKIRDDLNLDIEDPAEHYGLVLSDVTGAIPGGEGLQERLAFIYKRDKVKRTEVASDISIDRKPVLDFLKDQIGKYVDSLSKQIDDYKENRKDLLAWAKKWKISESRPRPPKAPTPEFAEFLTFVRSPYIVSFQLSPNSPNPYEIMAVGAHLVFGTPEQREKEFQALFDWLSNKLKNSSNAYYSSFALFGDLNLDIETDADRERVDDLIKNRCKEVAQNNPGSDIYFPFITPHPESPDEGTFRSNARLNQTYDQISFFSTDPRLPQSENRHTLGEFASLEDYGVFNFTNLFSKAIYNKSYNELSKSNTKKLVRKFEHTVSDHLPLWVRLHLPE